MKIIKRIIAITDVLSVIAIIGVFILPISDTIGYYIVLFSSLYAFVATIILCLCSQKARAIVGYIIDILLRA